MAWEAKRTGCSTPATAWSWKSAITSGAQPRAQRTRVKQRHAFPASYLRAADAERWAEEHGGQRLAGILGVHRICRVSLSCLTSACSCGMPGG